MTTVVVERTFAGPVAFTANADMPVFSAIICRTCPVALVAVPCSWTCTPCPAKGPPKSSSKAASRVPLVLTLPFSHR